MVPQWVHDRLDQLSEGLVYGKIVFTFQDGLVIQSDRLKTEREGYCAKVGKKGK